MSEKPESAREVVSESADRAAQRAETARARVGEQVSERGAEAGRQAESVAQTVREVGEQTRGRTDDLPRRLAEWTAAQAGRLGRYLRESEAESIVRDVKAFGRRQPWVVVGVGFAAGLAAARFLKASGNRTSRRWRG